MSKPLYEQDFVRWTEQQSAALRAAALARSNLPVDWGNVAEEIDSLGRSDRRELASRIATIIEHLLKLQASPADAPRRDWETTVRAQRREIGLLLDDSPSLRGEAAAMIQIVRAPLRDEVRQELARWGEQPRADIDGLQYTEAEVLGDWWPR